MTKYALAFGISDLLMILNALREWEAYQNNHDYDAETQAKRDPRFRDPNAPEKLAKMHRAIAQNRRMQQRILRHAQRLLDRHDALKLAHQRPPPRGLENEPQPDL